MLTNLGFKKIAKEKKPSVAKGLAFGGLAGGAATALTYPMDVRVTASQLNKLDKLKQVVREKKGLSKLKPYYRGMGEKLGKNVLQMGLTFAIFNALKNQL